MWKTGISRAGALFFAVDESVENQEKHADISMRRWILRLPGGESGSVSDPRRIILQLIFSYFLQKIKG